MQYMVLIAQLMILYGYFWDPTNRFQYTADLNFIG